MRYAATRQQSGARSVLTTPIHMCACISSPDYLCIRINTSPGARYYPRCHVQAGCNSLIPAHVQCRNGIQCVLLCWQGTYILASTSFAPTQRVLTPAVSQAGVPHRFLEFLASQWEVTVHSMLHPVCRVNTGCQLPVKKCNQPNSSSSASKDPSEKHADYSYEKYSMKDPEDFVMASLPDGSTVFRSKPR